MIQVWDESHFSSFLMTLRLPQPPPHSDILLSHGDQRQVLSCFGSSGLLRTTSSARIAFESSPAQMQERAGSLAILKHLSSASCATSSDHSRQSRGALAPADDVFQTEANSFCFFSGVPRETTSHHFSNSCRHLHGASTMFVGMATDAPFRQRSEPNHVGNNSVWFQKSSTEGTCINQTPPRMGPIQTQQLATPTLSSPPPLHKSHQQAPRTPHPQSH